MDNCFSQHELSLISLFEQKYCLPCLEEVPRLPYPIDKSSKMHCGQFFKNFFVCVDGMMRYDTKKLRKHEIMSQKIQNEGTNYSVFLSKKITFWAKYQLPKYCITFICNGDIDILIK